MLEKLRKKFIFYTMTAVISVFSVIILGINGLFLYYTANELDSVTQMIVDSDGNIRKPKNGNSHQKDNINETRRKTDTYHSDDKVFKSREMPYATRYFYAKTDDEYNILEINMDCIASVDDGKANKIITDIILSENKTGWNSTYRYRFSKTENGYMIVVLDSENQLKSLFSILGITILVSTVSIIVLFIIIRRIARKAVLPIAESYEKQKQFITDAGHELKTPLTAISANMAIVKMTSGESKWTDAIDRQTDKMIKLINHLISLSRMDEKKTVHETAEFHLSEAVQDTVESFGIISVSRKISVESSIKPNVVIVNNELMIRQLVSILMDNAVKYCDENGKVRVVMQNHNHTFGKNKILLTIQNDFSDTDNFDPDKVFERFYRGNKAHTSDGSFGLGLSIARNIADSCGIKLSAGKNDFSVVFTVII
ncbi:MAG: HAMP domain-containing sensor histidine kinase [Oscillospiraceae bacterium]|nr:HAMP domain-containing sensor histidine kinase [Oscillospiraceae bacterium]